MLDSLDTLWVMGMGKELDEAAMWLEQHVDFGKIGQVSFMETTIRALGGLLAAHEVSLCFKVLTLVSSSELGAVTVSLCRCATVPLYRCVSAPQS